MTVRLPVRLFLSYAAVAVVGDGIAYLTVRLLAPHLFDRQLSMMSSGASTMSMGDMTTGVVHAAFESALTTALVVGVLAGVIAAAVIAAVGTRRLLRPLNAVRAATRQIAAGHYGGTVPLPSEPELAALAADVNTLAHALADTENRRSRLLGEVAHEMRTPLTALDGYVEGLIDGVFTADPTTLVSLSEELRRLHRLSDDLSSMSRAQEQRLEVHLVDTDVADLARRAAARLSPQFQDATITLVVDADTPLPAPADPDRITQVLTNLLGNALLATPAGGTVTVAVRKISDQVRTTVTDTGSGLAAPDIERIFERFYRVPGQSRRSAGSGIGLTIARAIARAHQGDLSASSPGLNRGATFTLSLPAGPPHRLGS